MIKKILNSLILPIQVAGIVLVGIGLCRIWDPLAWIYAGVALYFFGNALYQAMESEERKT